MYIYEISCLLIQLFRHYFCIKNLIYYLLRQNFRVLFDHKVLFGKYGFTLRT